MNQNLTELVCIVDRSGSMNLIRTAAIEGFNHFVAGQRDVPGEGLLTLVLFDDEYDVVFDRLPLQRVPELTYESFVPRGSTALFDAVGRTIDGVGQRLASTREADRPGQVITSILTDGYENASRTYSLSDIADRIAIQRNVYGWEFVFLAANQDAIASASAMSIPATDAMSFAATPHGLQSAWAGMTETVKQRRGRSRC